MDLFNLALISEKWNSSEVCTWWESASMGLLFWIPFTLLFAVFLFMRKETVIECGYPKRKRKYMRKKLSEYSILDRVLLIRLVSEADEAGFILLLELLCHWASLLSYIATTVGFLGKLFAPGAGWADVLLLYPMPAILIITITLEFIPHLIWVPSERRRYR